MGDNLKGNNTINGSIFFTFEPGPYRRYNIMLGVTRYFIPLRCKHDLAKEPVVVKTHFSEIYIQITSWIPSKWHDLVHFTDQVCTNLRHLERGDKTSREHC